MYVKLIENAYPAGDGSVPAPQFIYRQVIDARYRGYVQGSDPLFWPRFIS